MIWGSIKALAAGYMHRTDMLARFDSLQELVMKDLSLQLDVTQNEAVAAFAFTAHPALVGLFQSPLPADFGRPKVFTPGPNQDAYTPTTLIAMLSNVATTQYAIVGLNVLTRNAAPLIGIYGQKVAVAANDAGENLFQSYYPTAVVYSLLVHACESIQDFDAVAQYQTKLDDAIGVANQDKAWQAMGPGATPQSSYSNP